MRVKVRRMLVMGSVGWLVACGGGGSADPGGEVVRVSGVVATGHAVGNARVSARCASGHAAFTAAAATSGHYEVELARDALPCLLEAVSTDGTVTLHSVAVGPPDEAGEIVAHITTLTELLVAQLAGTRPLTFMNKAGTDTLAALITPASVANAHPAVISVLRQMGVNPAVIVDVVAQPLVAATAQTPGDAHDRVLDDLAAAMRGSGARLSDLVSVVNGRRNLGYEPPIRDQGPDAEDRVARIQAE
jgi:hypothetical protein